MKNNLFSKYPFSPSISNTAKNSSLGDPKSEDNPYQIKHKVIILDQQLTTNEPEMLEQDSRPEPVYSLNGPEVDTMFPLSHRGVHSIFDKDKIERNGSNRISIKIPREWLDGKYNHVKTQLIKGHNTFTFEMKRDSLNISIEFYCVDVKKTLEFICTTYDLIFSEPGESGDVGLNSYAHSKCRNTSTFENSGSLTDNIVADIKSISTACRSVDQCMPRFNGSLSVLNLENIKISNRLFKTEVTSFLHVNFLLMKILYSKKYNGILRTYSCKLVQISGGNMTRIAIYGESRQHVNNCRREIEEMYYSNILVNVECDSLVNQHKGLGMIDSCQKNICKAFIEIIMAKAGHNMLFGDVDELFESFGAVHKCTVNLLVNSETGNFICGKKMGKIHKIACPYLKVLLIDTFKSGFEEPESFFNFKMQGPTNACIGCYRQLLDEFPYEMCFSVDRKYHKKIIGVDGCVIQRIMKKYNFYVKFLSSKETKLLGLENNVILRTPRKNKEMLSKAKMEILKYVGEENIIGNVNYVSMANKGILMRNGNNLKDMEQEHGKIGIELDAEISFESIKKAVEMNIQKERWY
ncbi:uncharacterized protein VICG_01401 [Vittaforma corneae ATCC 50505]|uniref:K Homology domain-containing protein n=1 Tax=Vittaforma corneae (strain ATCC 50505) TaxID=993615 RepID=L2GMK5_VITCO|nr:uncharacterized protein VICG_01401 [Vittaforma corneae ATCC 50505]ELA41537.1 hypothetical protein VICG_01401 [Vittaforma corneae ATCC 50505]